MPATPGGGGISCSWNGSPWPAKTWVYTCMKINESDFHLLFHEMAHHNAIFGSQDHTAGYHLMRDPLWKRHTDIGVDCHWYWYTGGGGGLSISKFQVWGVSWGMQIDKGFTCITSLPLKKVWSSIGADRGSGLTRPLVARRPLLPAGHPSPPITGQVTSQDVTLQGHVTLHGYYLTPFLTCHPPPTDIIPWHMSPSPSDLSLHPHRCHPFDMSPPSLTCHPPSLTCHPPPHHVQGDDGSVPWPLQWPNLWLQG